MEQFDFHHVTHYLECFQDIKSQMYPVHELNLSGSCHQSHDQSFNIQELAVAESHCLDYESLKSVDRQH